MFQKHSSQGQAEVFSRAAHKDRASEEPRRPSHPQKRANSFLRYQMVGGRYCRYGNALHNKHTV